MKSLNPALRAWVEQTPWFHQDASIWLATTFTLARNVEKHNFPAKLGLDRRRQMVALVAKEAGKVAQWAPLRVCKGEECSPVDREFFMEHSLAGEAFLQAHQGEAFLADSSGKFLLTVNIEDHLRLHLVETKGDLEGAWKRLAEIETLLGRSLGYSFSQKFGFLTSDPFHCGTGLLVKLFLQPSALIHLNKLPEILAKIHEEAIAVQGLQGENKEWVGDLVILQNSYTLGVKEENILSLLRGMLTKLLAEENLARREARAQESVELKDKVARAFGLLLHSYQLEVPEALNEIALLKLGVDLGWVQGVTMQELNELFFQCRRGHLLATIDEDVALEHVPHRRASMIHEALHNAALSM